MLAALTRPFIMFAQEPILQLFGIYFAFVYGTIYRKSAIYCHTFSEMLTLPIVVLTTVPAIFTDIYHEKTGILGLHYIALVSNLFGKALLVLNATTESRSVRVDTNQFETS